MPKNDQMFDIETLKNDPTMWSRLSTPLKDSKVLDRVCDGHENPFQRDEKAAEEKIRKLAAEGNLYLREMGKSG